MDWAGTGALKSEAQQIAGLSARDVRFGILISVMLSKDISLLLTLSLSSVLTTNMIYICVCVCLRVCAQMWYYYRQPDKGPSDCCRYAKAEINLFTTGEKTNKPPKFCI